MNLENLKETVSFLKSKTKIKPQVGIILGSGLGSFGDQINIESSLSFNEIPHFTGPSIEGHNGKIIFGSVGKTNVVCLQGRVHFYEGHSMETITYPMKTIAQLGIESLLVTNAAGGLDSAMEPGDFMIISDHINLMGTNPLIGPNFKELGPRFPDMTEAYSKFLREKMAKTMLSHNVKFHEGIYSALSGPSYETPAEIKYLRMIGSSAVGMSTVPEVIIANHMGIKVCGVSCITNKAAGLSPHKLSHVEVTETAKKVETQFSAFVKDYLISLTS